MLGSRMNLNTPSDKSSQVNNDTPVRILHAQLDLYYAHHDNKINDIIGAL